MRAVCLCLCLLIAFPAYGRAAEIPAVELKRGEAAPDDGAFFSGGAAISLLEALRDLDAGRKKLDALLEETKNKDGEIASYKDTMANLEEARSQTAVALAKAEFIIQNWEMINKAMLSVIDEHRKISAELRALNEQTMAALKDARAELWWTRLFSAIPILGMAALLFMGR